ncbi:DUF3822 family protein [Roseivirga sp. E12]|uniref:DUF3822 family protein n=1 Tax=Roseivirga sp. E12 TaxID=2819237 RepID=UPI001ABC0421|nr:DUF3822 family protein [Roseivirga sp. E12]MBO3700847.1 DUF3822 family protein [Roseivirga sp. E12]
MRSTNTPTRLSLKDERLDIDRIDQYRLSFFIGDDSCQISILDIQKKLLLLLEDVSFQSDLSRVENLQRLYDDHILIAAGFWKEVQVFIRNDKFSLVPVPVFDKSLLQEYIQLNQPTDPNEDEYRFKILDELGLSIAFAYAAEIKAWFKEKYPNNGLQFNHQSVAYLKGLQSQLRNRAQSSVYVLLNDKEVMIAGFNLSRVAIYNQFQFSDSMDLVKRILLTSRQYSEEGQSIPLLLHGIKDQVNEHLPTLKKYFRNIELGQRPSDIHIHPLFNELEQMEYFDVLSNL